MENNPSFITKYPPYLFDWKPELLHHHWGNHKLLWLDESLARNVRILNGCEVQIENSVTRVTDWHHKIFLLMSNSYLSDIIFNSQWTTIFFSHTLPSAVALKLEYMSYFIIIFTLKYINLQSRTVQFGSSQGRWCQNVWQKMTSKHQKASWSHAW